MKEKGPENKQKKVRNLLTHLGRFKHNLSFGPIGLGMFVAKNEEMVLVQKLVLCSSSMMTFK
jgi:hypothetical protein